MYSDIESEHNTETDVTMITERYKHGMTQFMKCLIQSKTVLLGQHTCNETDEDYAVPLSTGHDAVQYTSSDSPAPHYQPLDTVTTDYTSVYTTPTGRRGPPSMEVEGKMYSIVDPIKRETDTTYDTAIKEPYYM